MYLNGEYIRGSVYLDKSTKYYKDDKVIKHNCYRLEVTYNGKRIRERHGSKEQAIEALRELQRIHQEQSEPRLFEC